MAKRIVRRWDEERTELLDQSELFVQEGKGSEYYYYAWLQEPEVETCPLCSGKAIKMQDLFSKTYQELIRKDDSPTVVTLEYGFHNMLIRDLVNAYQTDYIKEIADQGACVIVGRSADYILADRKDCLNVFICGDLADRAERVVKEHEVDARIAESHVLERDKKRSRYYRHVTDQVWGLSENYDLCLNSSELGIDKCVEIILACCQ